MKTIARLLARWPRWTAVSALACLLVAPVAAGPDADALKARHAALAGELAHNAFQRPLHMLSTESGSEIKGEVYAVVDHSFQTLNAALRSPDRWCEVLSLPFNVKQCRASGAAPAPRLEMAIGRKYDQPIADAYKVDFQYRLDADDPDYLKVLLNAASGPLGTRDYRISFEAVPLDANRSFIHLAYSYGYGWAARLAMQGYLSTIGSQKVGFSVVDRRPDGKPVYVGKMRGVIERNTMRYYLAIDAYLESLAVAPRDRVEHRLQSWFAATERYPLQLHEITQDEYMTMKRREIERQKAG